MSANNAGTTADIEKMSTNNVGMTADIESNPTMSDIAPDGKATDTDIESKQVMVPKARQSSVELFLNQLQVDVTGTIIVMIGRKWDVSVVNGRYLSTDFVVFDAKGNMVDCTARSNVAHNFLRLHEGTIYSIKNIAVKPNKEEYRILKNDPIMVEFDGSTTIRKALVKAEGFVRFPFQLVDFDNIEPTNNKYFIDKLYLSNNSSTMIFDNAEIPALKTLRLYENRYRLKLDVADDIGHIVVVLFDEAETALVKFSVDTIVEADNQDIYVPTPLKPTEEGKTTRLKLRDFDVDVSCGLAEVGRKNKVVIHSDKKRRIRYVSDEEFGELDAEVVEQETEETTDKEQTNFQRSTAHIQPPVTLIPKPDVPKTLPKPNIPYPSRFNDQKLREKATNQMEKFFQIFQDLHFNIIFANALLLMPKFASTIKSLLTNKDKLFELAKIPLNENCSAMLLKKLPKKLRDPGKFLIPCDFLGMDVCHALADLDASINLMPLSIRKKLSLPELTPTRMTLELADRSITHPKGVIEDVFVKVGKFHFSTDFVVVDFEADPRVPLILGRSFLRTGRSLINVYREEITLRVNDEAVTFNLNQTTRYSSTYVICR
uniref:Reverse transcriptase domain-containing protein n=1 Tax=Tanacetum cinerariifolium TaxID=118510 RepID=A0A6L2K8N2_TANCI|nr:reverse transcriptase domain-containing protein [Tanacetum cinerariifolium]